MKRLILLALVAAASMSVASPAEAYWTRYGWRRPVFVGPRYYYARPPVVVVGPPYVVGRVWIPPHYRGPYFIPGHWR